MKHVNVFFVTSYPRSDMGKGTFIAQALNVVNNSDAIKFDGLLNTNENGRHTEKGHDDFGIYEAFNPNKQFGKEHYILAGEIYQDFIAKYGENENLQLNPHLSYYLEYKIMYIWNQIGRPKNLFIEIGGVMTDFEVAPLFKSIIKHFIKD
jgi:CTP synthase (UTP-ammonia lyase)